jgi:predicted branched-subunit amino acid permease
MEEVRTNIRLSICCCITWILLLALTAIPCGLCAFFCSLYSISLKKKGDTERAQAKALCALYCIIFAGYNGYFWLYGLVAGAISELIVQLTLPH